VITLQAYLNTFYLQTTLSGIVAIISFYKFKRREKYIKLIGLSFLFGFLANILSLVISNFKSLNGFINIPHVLYFVSNFAFLTLAYYYVFGKRGGKWLVAATSIFLPFTLANILYFQKASINSYSNVLLSVIIIIYCIVYFYKLMIDMPSLYIHHLPMFWFNAAFLIFHSGTFFLFAFTAYLINVLKNDLIVYWSFHNIISIIEHLIVLVGLYYDLRGIKAQKARNIS
jgi:hypothetical protein